MNEHDFDKFLQDVNDEATQQRDAEQEGHELERRAEQLLDEHVPSRAFSFDPDTQTNLRAALLQAVIDDPHSYGPDWSDDFIERNPEYIVESIIQQQRTLVFITMITAAANNTELNLQPNSQPKIDATKKQLIAQLLVVHKLSPDDEFVTFADNLVPGAMLDLTSDSDAHYLTEALETYAHQQEEAKKAGEFVATATELFALSTHSEDDVRSIIVECFTMYATHSLKDNSSSQLEAAFDEITRKYNIDQDIANKLAAILADYRSR